MTWGGLHHGYQCSGEQWWGGASRVWGTVVKALNFILKHVGKTLDQRWVKRREWCFSIYTREFESDRWSGQHIQTLGRGYVRKSNCCFQSLSQNWLIVTPWTAACWLPCPSQSPRVSQTHAHWVKLSGWCPSSTHNHLILCWTREVYPFAFR